MKGKLEENQEVTECSEKLEEMNNFRMTTCDFM